MGLDWFKLTKAVGITAVGLGVMFGTLFFSPMVLMWALLGACTLSLVALVYFML